MADTVYAVFKTNHGDFTVELFPDKAPITVANFRKLAESAFTTARFSTASFPSS